MVARPPWWTVWLLAARPKTLWAGISPVMVGTALAWRDHTFLFPAALAALLGAVLIQIGANFANDLSDHIRGADAIGRRGPTRATQAGWVTPKQMWTAVIITFILAFAVGLYLVTRGGWPIVVIGLASLTAALLYTGGPYPFGYYGLGDLFVFIFFGPVAVAGTYYVQALSVNQTVWLSSVPMGTLATAVLCVNNLRDIDSDRRAGKLTLAVRLGRRGAAWEYVGMLALAFVSPGALFVRHDFGPAVLLASAVILAGAQLAHRSFAVDDGPSFNRLLAATARLQAIYALAFAVGANW
jgi:1,4-dihydroxy-2-naphthoate octaprenyltransferase